MFVLKSRRLITSAVLLVSAVSVATAQHIMADISGTWMISAQSPQGNSESTAVLEQKGTAVSGTINVPELGSAKLAGSVKGDTVAMGFTLDVQGQQIPVQMNGVVKDKDNMSGSIVLPADMGSYPFSAKRKP